MSQIKMLKITGDYCEFCKRHVHSWDTHRHSAEHERNTKIGQQRITK